MHADKYLKPHVCRKCAVKPRFASRGLLLRHDREVHGKNKKGYICLVEDCRRVFSRKSNCKDHFARKHQKLVWSDSLTKAVNMSDLGEGFARRTRVDYQVRSVGEEVAVDKDDCPCDDDDGDLDGSGIVNDAVEVEVDVV
jgi:hypothetical protein